MFATREAAAAVVFEYDDDGKLTWCVLFVPHFYPSILIQIHVSTYNPKYYTLVGKMTRMRVTVEI